MNNINKYIELYLADMQLAWSKTTLRSEKYRLVAVAEALDGNPPTLWSLLQTKKPYTRTTTWVRVCRFWDWLINEEKIEGINPYARFKRKNRRLFKNSYCRVPARFSYAEVRSRINNIDSDNCKKTAIWLLENGLRFSEFKTINGDTVVGKGGRSRAIYVTNLPRPNTIPEYAKFRRALLKIGLKPHDLRKSRLTNLVDKGINEFELCEIAGWASLNTASSYVRVNKNKLKEIMNGKQILR